MLRSGPGIELTLPSLSSEGNKAHGRPCLVVPSRDAPFVYWATAHLDEARLAAFTRETVLLLIAFC